jgi:non-homologous end joining protein Ku
LPAEQQPEEPVQKQALRPWRPVTVAGNGAETFRDRYEEALLAHLKAKQAGTVQERKPRFGAPHRVINLMEALRRSVAEDKKLAALRTEVAPARKRP